MLRLIHFALETLHPDRHVRRVAIMRMVLFITGFCTLFGFASCTTMKALKQNYNRGDEFSKSAPSMPNISCEETDVGLRYCYEPIFGQSTKSKDVP